jgi:DNA primase catalytic core
MPIDKKVIEQAKRCDLVALVQAKGIQLKKNGKSHMGLCPFHADKNPSLSINAQKNLWQCFGCGAAGDAIRFVELFDQVDFKEAVARLSVNGDRLSVAKTKAKEPKPEALTVKQRKLLARVVGHYQHALGSKDTKGLDYLQKQRGITDTQSLKDFGAGYANGTLLEILPQDPQVIDQLKTIGILNKKGNEVFYNCVVFPLYNAKGSIVNLYGRNISDEAGTTHLYLPGPRSGLVNRQAVKRSQTIILTESIIDALTLYDQGFKNVIPIYGVNGLVDEHLSLLHRKIKAAYLVFDSDEPGKRAVDAVSLRLKEKGITPYPVTLTAEGAAGGGIKDVNIYFKRHSPEQFEALLKAANPNSCEQSEKVSKREQNLYKETDHGFMVGFGGRQYEIKGIQRSQTQLKVVVNASTDVTNSRLPFELATIDLYSSRSRIWLAKLCADLFEADQALVKEDIGRLLTLVEDFKPRQKQKSIAEPTKAEKQAAMAFLKSPKLFDQILADLETLGAIGRRKNKQDRMLPGRRIQKACQAAVRADPVPQQRRKVHASKRHFKTGSR